MALCVHLLFLGTAIHKARSRGVAARLRGLIGFYSLLFVWKRYFETLMLRFSAVWNSLLKEQVNKLGQLEKRAT